MKKRAKKTITLCHCRFHPAEVRESWTLVRAQLLVIVLQGVLVIFQLLRTW